MTRRFRNVTAIAAVAVWFSSSTGAQQPPAGQAHDHDTHHREMLTRGAQAMGFDQERTVHHFLLYEDGGAIDVAVKEASDHANLQTVRQHLQQIAGLFKAGDFGKPALTHAQQVPGTADMTRLKDRITYQYEETPGGGRVRIVTRDTEARAAVHAFLHFQIEDHRTGDSGVVQQPSAPGRTMNGMGRGMMMQGGHDAGAMAQMRDIHELFANHDRMTRTVTNLADGIRTVTESNDPQVAKLITDHVASSRKQVDTGIDPGLPIESPALRAIYAHYDKIVTTVEATEKGVVVVQTSTDAQVVAALQQHAAEVTEFIKDGMAAMHKAMMKNGGMMQPGIHGGTKETASQGKTTPNPR
ncbi:MAG TPA: hypothetical protein VI485_08500 [Vicinamibacterales bacterium]|nr:hypothetical protein [Vicinamibacterales bacterium]